MSGKNSFAYTEIILSQKSKPYHWWLHLTHWGSIYAYTHICVSRLTIIGSDNGLSPGRHQAIIRTNDGVLLLWSLGTIFSEILIKSHIFSFKQMHLNMSPAKCWPFYLGLPSWWPLWPCHQWSPEPGSRPPLCRWGTMYRWSYSSTAAWSPCPT